MKTLFLIVFLGPLSAQDNTTAQVEQVAEILAIEQVVDRARLSETEPFLLQFFEGKPVGSMVLSIDLGEEEIVVHDRTRVARFDIEEELIARIDVRSFQLKSFSGSGHFGKENLEIQLVQKDGGLQGHMALPRSPKKDVKLDLPAGTVERTVLFALLPCLKFETYPSFSLNMFNSMETEVKRVDVAISGPEKMTVMTGEVDAWKIVLSGGEAQTFYVSKDLPARILKIEVGNSKWSYELLHP